MFTNIILFRMIISYKRHIEFGCFFIRSRYFV